MNLTYGLLNLGVFEESQYNFILTLWLFLYDELVMFVKKNLKICVN